MSSEMQPATETASAKKSPALVIVLVVLAMFAGLLLAKSLLSPQPATSSGATAQTAPTAGGSPTSTRNDAVADYEAALKTGKPVYVLFHSLTCDPCVAISAVADGVLPDYEGKVTFVNAITDDPSAQQLASQFSFQYIPTSFFLEADGTVANSFTGEMDEAQMRGYLDALAAE